MLGQEEQPLCSRDSWLSGMFGFSKCQVFDSLCGVVSGTSALQEVKCFMAEVAGGKFMILARIQDHTKTLNKIFKKWQQFLH